MLDLTYYVDPQRQLRIAKIYIHPEWNPYQLNYDANIAILKLATTIDYSAYVKSVCLPSASENLQGIIGENARVAGWGSSEQFSEIQLKFIL